MFRMAAMIRSRSQVVRAALLAGLIGCALPALAARDVMLVLDNSGSMRRNDPGKLAVVAVKEFIQSQPTDTRVGIVLFAQAAELTAPLTPVDAASADVLIQALSKFDYRGRWTQIASGVERALYELRQEGRADAERVIVLMTDGLIDTGDAGRDAELKQWLETGLSADAKRERVGIYGIAFTELADYRLLQSLAAVTGAEYFRVLDPQDLSQSLQRIEAMLAATAAPPQAPTPPLETPSPPPAPFAAGPPLERPVSPAWRWALSALVVTVLAVLLWWRRGWLQTFGRRAMARGDEPAGPRGVLVDVSHPNGPRHYPVLHRPLVIGRQAGSDPGQDYVVVPEKTVGRWHATILRRGQTFLVRDEQSANGTFVNGERISGEHVLKHGDMVRTHTRTFEFQIPDLAHSENTVMKPSRH